MLSTCIQVGGAAALRRRLHTVLAQVPALLRGRRLKFSSWAAPDAASSTPDTTSALAVIASARSVAAIHMLQRLGATEPWEWTAHRESGASQNSLIASRAQEVEQVVRIALAGYSLPGALDVLEAAAAAEMALGVGEGSKLLVSSASLQHDSSVARLSRVRERAAAVSAPLITLAALEKTLAAAVAARDRHSIDRVTALALGAPTRRLSAQLVRTLCGVFAGAASADHARGFAFAGAVAAVETASVRAAAAGEGRVVAAAAAAGVKTTPRPPPPAGAPRPTKTTPRPPPPAGARLPTPTTAQVLRGGAAGAYIEAVAREGGGAALDNALQFAQATPAFDAVTALSVVGALLRLRDASRARAWLAVAIGNAKLDAKLFHPDSPLAAALLDAQKACASDNNSNSGSAVSAAAALTAFLDDKASIAASASASSQIVALHSAALRTGVSSYNLSARTIRTLPPAAIPALLRGALDAVVEVATFIANREAAWEWLHKQPLTVAIDIIRADDYDSDDDVVADDASDASGTPQASASTCASAFFPSVSLPQQSLSVSDFKSYHLNLALSALGDAGDVRAAAAIVADFSAAAKRLGRAFPSRPNERTYNVLLAAATRVRDTELVVRLLETMRGECFVVAEEAWNGKGGKITAGPTTLSDVSAVSAWLNRLEALPSRGNNVDGMLHEAAVAFYRLGSPGMAVKVLLDAPRRFGVTAFRGDALRTHVTGLMFSGGSSAHGLAKTEIPLLWGGSVAEENETETETMMMTKGYYQPPTLPARFVSIPWALKNSTIEAPNLVGLGAWLQAYRSAAFTVAVRIREREGRNGMSLLPPTELILEQLATTRSGSGSGMPPPLAEFAVIELLRHFRVGQGEGFVGGDVNINDADAALSFSHAEEDPLAAHLPVVLAMFRSGAALIEVRKKASVKRETGRASRFTL